MNEIKDNDPVFDVGLPIKALTKFPLSRFPQAAFNKNFQRILCWGRWCLDLVFQKQSEEATPEKIILTHGRIMGSRYNKC